MWWVRNLGNWNSSSSVMKKSAQPPPLTNTDKNFHSNSGILSPKTPTSANIEDTETWETDKRFTVYKVYIQSQGKSWFLFRRYNEFYRLYEIVKKVYPNSQLKLPGKRILGNNFDPSFIKARKEGLSEFIDQLLSDPRFIQITEVRTFLGLDNPKNLQDNSVDVEDDDKKDSFEMPDDKVNLGPTERPHGKPSDFEFLKVIGKGSFGKVLVAKHKLENRIYAIKVLQKQQIMKRNEAKHIMSERNVLLKNLTHPFLVGLHYSFQTRDKLYFVLDYVNGGELFFHLQRERFFSEPRAQFYSAEIGCAIGYLHSQHIVYRDLKPENLLLDSEGHIVLTDFGLCKEGIEATGTTTTFCGTPEYLAPEVLKKLPYDRTVDWWCLGAVLYEMLYGLPPFYSRDTAEMYDNILHKPLRLRSNVSVAARHILERLLDKDLRKRLGAGENDFLDVKNHDFYHSINWEDLEARKIRPPYNPNVSGNLDLKHFDPEFIREPVPASLAKSSGQALISASVQDAADEAFIGFSYAPPLEEEMF